MTMPLSALAEATARATRVAISSERAAAEVLERVAVLAEPGTHLLLELGRGGVRGQRDFLERAVTRVSSWVEAQDEVEQPGQRGADLVAALAVDLAGTGRMGSGSSRSITGRSVSNSRRRKVFSAAEGEEQQHRVEMP